MSSLQILVTNAGRAALVAAQTSGTNSVSITSIQLSGAAFTAVNTMTSISNVVATINTVAGSTIDDYTIHVTATDSTSNTYTTYGFGIFLSDGTLFAVYGQTTELMTKEAGSTLVFDTNITFSDITTTSITYGSVSFSYPDASSTTIGVSRFATNAEASTGTSSTIGITPSNLASVLTNYVSSPITKYGTLTLASGTATLTDSSLTTSSLVLLTPQSSGTGSVSVTSTSTGSFVIGSTDSTDSRIIAYIIIND